MSEYFVTEPGGEPTAEGRFVSLSEVDQVSFLPGLDFQPVLGENVLVNHVHFAPHVEAPTHTHVEEQVVVVLEGELDFWVGDERRVLHRGDLAVIPPWVPHGGVSGEQGCLEIDVFSPPRAQFLPLLRPSGQGSGQPDPQ